MVNGLGSYEVKVSSDGSCEVMVDGHFWVKFGVGHSEVVVGDWEEEVMVG